MFNNDLVAIPKSKVTLKFKNPAYVGVSLLDLSKVLMYEFHYDYITIKYKNHSRELFTDIDELFEIETEDVDKDVSKNKEMFDFTIYTAASKYYYDSKKLVVGKMKYETSGVAIK